MHSIDILRKRCKTSNMAPTRDFAFIVRVILLLACILGVELTCNPHEDFTELSICRDAQHTGWSFYIDTLSIQENNAAYCKCSVNISDEVQDVQVSYNYQGPSSNCTRGFEINLANFSLACNATSMTVAAQDVDAIEFRKETSGQAEPACLLVYIASNQQPATVTCYEITTLSTPTNNATISVTSNSVHSGLDNTTSTITSTISSVSTKAQSSTDLRVSRSTESQTQPSISTSTESTTTLEPEEFNEIIVIAVVAGVGGFLLILVLVVICITCCRSKHSAATYDVKRKQLDSTSTSDIDLTENAFYNVALVNSSNYYS